MNWYLHSFHIKLAAVTEHQPMTAVLFSQRMCLPEFLLIYLRAPNPWLVFYDDHLALAGGGGGG